MKTLVIGGARSGKSRFAEGLAQALGKPVTVLATAQAWDGEMAWRITQHRQNRPACWQTLEEPLAIGEVLERESLKEQTILLDCLTLWLSNLLMQAPPPASDAGFEVPESFSRQREQFLRALENREGDTILVSNELGWGVVPMGAANRWFVDEMGRLNQAVAERCDRVVLVAAGLPLYLKGGNAAV